MAEPDPNENSVGITAAESSLQVSRDEELRTPFFCEENVWRLAYRKLNEPSADRYYVVFISNAVKSVPMFHQRASSDPDRACCWDYHVILLRDSNGQVDVLDTDSRLPYPSALGDYLRDSFPYDGPAPYLPQFRLIEASLFLQHFSSDRMHMYNQQKGQWNANLPDYDCILSGPSNLDHYLNFVGRPMRHGPPPSALGELLSLKDLREYNFGAR